MVEEHLSYIENEKVFKAVIEGEETDQSRDGQLIFTQNGNIKDFNLHSADGDVELSEYAKGIKTTISPRIKDILENSRSFGIYDLMNGEILNNIAIAQDGTLVDAKNLSIIYSDKNDLLVLPLVDKAYSKSQVLNALASEIHNAFSDSRYKKIKDKFIGIKYIVEEKNPDDTRSYFYKKMGEKVYIDNKNDALLAKAKSNNTIRIDGNTTLFMTTPNTMMTSDEMNTFFSDGIDCGIEKFSGEKLSQKKISEDKIEQEIFAASLKVLTDEIRDFNTTPLDTLMNSSSFWAIKQASFGYDIRLPKDPDKEFNELTELGFKPVYDENGSTRAFIKISSNTIDEKWAFSDFDFFAKRSDFTNSELNIKKLALSEILKDIMSENFDNDFLKARADLKSSHTILSSKSIKNSVFAYVYSLSLVEGNGLKEQNAGIFNYLSNLVDYMQDKNVILDMESRYIAKLISTMTQVVKNFSDSNNFLAATKILKQLKSLSNTLEANKIITPQKLASLHKEIAAAISPEEYRASQNIKAGSHLISSVIPQVLTSAGTKILIDGKFVDLGKDVNYVNMCYIEDKNNSDIVKIYAQDIKNPDRTFVVEYDALREEIVEAKQYDCNFKGALLLDTDFFSLSEEEHTKLMDIIDPAIAEENIKAMLGFLREQNEARQKIIDSYNPISRMIVTLAQKTAKLLASFFVPNYKEIEQLSPLEDIEEIREKFAKNIDLVFKDVATQKHFQKQKDVISFVFKQLMRNFNVGNMKPEVLVAKIGANLEQSIGFLGTGYSTLQHSVNVAKIVELNLVGSHKTEEEKKELILKALLHDATEAMLMGDVPTPVKDVIPEIRDYEASFAEHIYSAVGIKNTYMDDIIHFADRVERATSINLHFKSPENLIRAADIFLQDYEQDIKSNISDNSRRDFLVGLLKDYESYIDNPNAVLAHDYSIEFIKKFKLDIDSNIGLTKQDYMLSGVDMSVGKNPDETMQEYIRLLNYCGIQTTTDMFINERKNISESVLNLSNLDYKTREGSFVREAIEILTAENKNAKLEAQTLSQTKQDIEEQPKVNIARPKA
ncbi:YfbR-like 5'-deoxynucleotidase [Campylobacter sp. RM16188]|uniref:YfbR-like 5'-deoxynucleotidase n=1 Tax=Campylobacter sp. RM16188 TaxID=1705725 RepID=UPI001557ADCE|nr:YfbR-like 5'-deoxynucleotidase [Campylobacter sp. RM16188]